MDRLVKLVIADDNETLLNLGEGAVRAEAREEPKLLISINPNNVPLEEIENLAKDLGDSSINAYLLGEGIKDEESSKIYIPVQFYKLV